MYIRTYKQVRKYHASTNCTDIQNSEFEHTTPGSACSGVGVEDGDDVLESLLDSFEEPHPPLPHTGPSYTLQH